MASKSDMAAAGAGIAVGIFVAGALAWVSGQEEEPEPASVARARSVPTEILKIPKPEAKKTQPEVSDDPAATEAVERRKCGQGKQAGFFKPNVSEVGRVAVYVPTSYVEAQLVEPRDVPVVVLFHDDAQDGEQFLKVSGFLEIAEQEGMPLVAPLDNDLLAWSDEDSARVVGPIVDFLHDEYCVNREEVYVAGFGAGGRPAERAPCILPVAGVATASFRGSEGEVMCRPEKVPPMITMVPKKDGHSPLDGSPGCGGFNDPLSMDEKVTALRTQNGCKGETSDFTRFDASVCRQHDCESPLVVCEVDGGRRWPGTRKRLFDGLHKCDGPVTSLPYARVMWSFFRGTEPPQR